MNDYAYYMLCYEYYLYLAQWYNVRYDIARYYYDLAMACDDKNVEIYYEMSRMLHNYGMTDSQFKRVLGLLGYLPPERLF